MPSRSFFGWRVVWAAFVIAVFGWGLGFYGPPVFLQAIHERRGWPVSLVSAAVTTHFLLGAAVVANLAALHRRFGLVAVTRAGGLAAALGIVGWALAAEPWQLFAATLLSGFGWAATGAAAINAMVSPWFARQRPRALSAAYNGASVGGVLLSPLWAALIPVLGFPAASGLIGVVAVAMIWSLAGRFLGRDPAQMGLYPDGEATPPAARAAAATGALWGDRRFMTLTAASALGLFAQIGLIAHLFSLLVPTLGEARAGLAAGLATACAIAGRFGLGWALAPGMNRRHVLAGVYLLQAVGSVLLLAAGGTSVALLLLGVAVFGLGLGNATSLPPLIAQQDFAPAETPRVVALVTAWGQACYAFAPAAFGALRDLGADGTLFGAALLIQLAAAIVLISPTRPAADLPCAADRANP